MDIKVTLPHPENGNLVSLCFDSLDNALYALWCLKEGNLELSDDGTINVKSSASLH